ncbi:MAG: hypothetical protein ACUVVU_08330 [Tepidimonas sp.]|uniref:hypothetical protein n=1 Tax=Tepidimonas sp. TaxID=2002775 RepID=UPI004054A13D
MSLSVLVGTLNAPIPVHSEDPVNIPAGPIPLDEELKPVEFSFLTVDATAKPSTNGLILQVRTRLRLRNPDKRNGYERQVGYSGPEVSNVRIGTQNGGLVPNGDPGPWKLALPRDGDAIIEGTQYVAARGVLAELRFDWAALAPWGAPLGAARFTLHFPEDQDPDQFLAVSPEPTERSAVALTWSREKFNPDGQVRVLYIIPQYWTPVRDARARMAAGQLNVDSFLALAAALRPLVTAEGMPPAAARAYQAEMSAALRQAVAAGPDNAAAHAELAAYLITVAQGNAATLAEAVSELQAAVRLAPADGSLQNRLLLALDGLLAACREAGDRRGLLSALDLAEALGARSSPERAAGYADLIVGLLDADRAQEAEATIVAGFGAEALARYSDMRPRFAAVAGEIETLPGLRHMTFDLSPAPGMEATAERDIATLVQDLQTAGARVQRTGENGSARLTITMPFTLTADLQVTSLRYAAAVPAEADPALALIGAALGPASTRYQTSSLPQADRLRYNEQVDLQPAQEALEQRLARLEAARAEAQAPTDDALEAARRRWVLALLDHYEAQWRVLKEGARVRYRLAPAEQVVAPEWLVAWGEQRALTWSNDIPRFDRLTPYVVGAVIVLIGVVVGLAVWQAARASQRSTQSRARSTARCQPR